MSEPAVVRSFRIPVELSRRLDEIAEGSGRTRTSLVRDALERVVAEGASGGSRGPETVVGVGPPEPPPEPLRGVDLDVWLAGRLGVPRTVARARIKAGRVCWPDGSPCGLRIRADRLADVRVDGQPV